MGGLPNRLGAAATQINNLKSEVVKSAPAHFFADKYIEGYIVACVGMEGCAQNAKGGIRMLESFGFQVRLDIGKTIYIKSPYCYSFLVSNIGTPGNLVGKPVRIKYRGNTLEDMEGGELSFTDIQTKKQQEARIAQPYSIGFIHGNMGGMQGRDLLHKPSEVRGEFVV